MGGGYSKTFEPERSAFKRPLQRSAFFVLVPYCFCWVNVHKLDFLFRTLLKIRPAAREARLYLLKLRSWSSAPPLGKRGLSENIYIFKKQFNSRNYSESADRECIRPHSSALMTRGEKTHGRFPLVAPLFPSAVVPQRQNATHAITAGRTKRTQRTQKARTLSKILLLSP